jgi:hypothetical protein
MKPRLYLDGCSFVWGSGLDPQYNLNSLFSREFDVVNYSRGGKSNLAIAMDYYKYGQDFDVAVIGWTFATRFYLRYKDADLDFFPSNTKEHRAMIPTYNPENPGEDSYFEFHEQFYKLFDVSFTNDLSNMLINNSYLLAQRRRQKTAFFSWECRTVRSLPLYRPRIPNSMLLPCGHLDQSGTELLYTELRQKINE